MSHKRQPLDSKNTESKAETMPKKVPTKAINLEREFHARFKLNEEKVNEYAELMDEGIEFPPVVVYKIDGCDELHLVEGFHRVHAAKSLNREEIDAFVKEGSRENAILHAVSADSKHGLARTNEDKRKCVEMLLSYYSTLKVRPSDREIAKSCGVSNTFIGNMRKKIEHTSSSPSTKVKGKDGRITETSNIGSNQKAKSKDVEKQTKDPTTHQESTLNNFETLDCSLPEQEEQSSTVNGLQSQKRENNQLAKISDASENLGIENTIPEAVGSKPTVNGLQSPTVNRLQSPKAGLSLSQLDGSRCITEKESRLPEGGGNVETTLSQGMNDGNGASSIVLQSNNSQKVKDEISLFLNSHKENLIQCASLLLNSVVEALVRSGDSSFWKSREYEDFLLLLSKRGSLQPSTKQEAVSTKTLDCEHKKSATQAVSDTAKLAEKILVFKQYLDSGKTQRKFAEEKWGSEKTRSRLVNYREVLRKRSEVELQKAIDSSEDLQGLSAKDVKSWL